MLHVESRYATDPESTKALDTEHLRDHFLVEDLFNPQQIRLIYSHYDRLILGSAVPTDEPLILEKVAETGTEQFLERREMAILNLADKAKVVVDDVGYNVGKGEVLYIGMGSGPVSFHAPGRFYLLSAPAHKSWPTRLITLNDAKRVEMGSAETANQRVIIQFLHPDVCPSCQLLMGYTQFAPGSVWNTMPAHVHDRRMEAYLYFELSTEQRVFHLMGKPDQTRHLVVKNEQAVISPPWSIHCGAGTGAYTFCWAMAGDNVDFTDMTPVSMEDLR